MNSKFLFSITNTSADIITIKAEALNSELMKGTSSGLAKRPNEFKIKFFAKNNSRTGITPLTTIYTSNTRHFLDRLSI